MRSRGDNMSPRMMRASAMRPPAPSPWMARKAASSYIDVAVPHRSEPSHERTEREYVQRLAAEQVRELAVQRRGDGRGDEVRRRDPRLQGEAVEVVADGADGRVDDHLVQGGQEHADHEAADDEVDLSAVQQGCGGGFGHDDSFLRWPWTRRDCRILTACGGAGRKLLAARNSHILRTAPDTYSRRGK